MRHRGERGAALIIVVFALFVLGLLSSTAFVLGFAERRIGRKFVRFHQASAAADMGAFEPVIQWDTRQYNRLGIGDSASFQGEVSDGTGEYSGFVTRVGSRMFLVTSEGVSTDSSARQRAATVLRLRPLQVRIDAALRINGPLEIGQSVRVSGTEQPPYGWSCPPPTFDLAAIKCPATDPSTPPWTGCPASECLTGNPLWAADTSSPGAAPFDLGQATLGDLEAIASHRLDGGTLRPQARESNGTCVTADPNNWGDPYDPWGPCGDHFPAIYSEGDLHVRAGQGQGVLFVEGDLTVSDGFHYFGVVIVLGSFNSLGVGSEITGAVIVANRGFETQTLEGATRIRYSNCVVGRSLGGSGRGVLLRERSWLDLY